MKAFFFFAIVALYAFFAFEPPRVPVEKGGVVHAAEIVAPSVITDTWLRQ